MFYGRMMFRLESAPTASVHWTIIEGSGLVPVDGQSYHALYRYGGQQPVMNGTTFVGSQLMANYETPDSYSGTGPSSGRGSPGSSSTSCRRRSPAGSRGRSPCA
jgi:hypothetical protein